MPHKPEPWFRPSRHLWYVELDGKQEKLGKHPDGHPPPEKRAGIWNTPQPILDAFYRLMAERSQKTAKEKADAKIKKLPAAAAAVVIEKFVQWCSEHRAEKPYEWYQWRLQLFLDSLPSKMTPVDQLKHHHLDTLLAQHPGWARGMKHSACRAVMRCFRWAKKKGHTDINPFEDYEKPAAGKRNVVVSPHQFAEILDLCGSQNFRDLLEITWETACRPQESLAVEARHVDLENARWFFPPDESKGEEWPRIVYLTDRAIEITKRLMEQYPTGKLFRNEDGAAWVPFAVNCAFGRVQIRMGLREMKKREVTVEGPPRFNRRDYENQESLKKARAEQAERLREHRSQLSKIARQHAPKYCLYHLRHSWLDRALKRGLDVLTCAILMGHRDPSTLAKVYQHVSQSPEYPRESARKAGS